MTTTMEKHAEEIHVTKDELQAAIMAVDMAEAVPNERDLVSLDLEHVPYVLRMWLAHKQEEYLRTPVDLRPERPIIVATTQGRHAWIPAEHRPFIKGWLSELGAEVYGGHASASAISLSPTELNEAADALRDAPIAAQETVVIDARRHPLLASLVRAQAQAQAEQNTKLAGAMGFDSNIVARDDRVEDKIYVTTTWQRRLEMAIRDEARESAMRMAALETDMQRGPSSSSTVDETTRKAARDRRRFYDPAPADE